MKSFIRQGAVPVLAVVDGAVSYAANRRGLPPYQLRAKTHNLRFALGGRWLQIGRQMLQEVVDFAGLTPESNVVEIGCACGIVAIPMKTYLTTGTYTGLDIIPDGLEWCRANLADDRFRFFDLEVRHELYNPRATNSSKDVRFPISDNSIDVVFLISVFTHLLQDEVSHYLGEIARILKPAGRCMATMLTKDNYVPSQSQIRFDYVYSPNCLCFSKKHPTWAVAFSRSLIEDIADEAGVPVERMVAGRWDGQSRQSFLHDMYVFRKPPGSIEREPKSKVA
jgi:ubiquinone/menaquinone biosynthesis C-methylase UbiE